MATGQLSWSSSGIVLRFGSSGGLTLSCFPGFDLFLEGAPSRSASSQAPVWLRGPTFVLKSCDFRCGAAKMYFVYYTILHLLALKSCDFRAGAAKVYCAYY